MIVYRTTTLCEIESDEDQDKEQMTLPMPIVLKPITVTGKKRIDTILVNFHSWENELQKIQQEKDEITLFITARCT